MGFARHLASSALLGASRLPIEPYFCPPSVQRLSGSTSSSGSISWISPFLPSPDATTLSWTVPTALLLFPPSPVLQASLFPLASSIRSPPDILSSKFPSVISFPREIMIPYFLPRCSVFGVPACGEVVNLWP